MISCSAERKRVTAGVITGDLFAGAVSAATYGRCWLWR